MLDKAWSAKETGEQVKAANVGCSDILGMLKDGRFLACEVKAPKGKLRPEQREFPVSYTHLTLPTN